MRALRDAGEGAHPQRTDLVRAERLGAHVLVRSGDLLRAIGEPLGRQLVRGGVREIPRAVGRLGDLRSALRRCERAVVRADEDEPLERPRPVAVRLPATRVVVAEHEPVDRRAGLLGRGQRQRVVEDPRDRAADARGGAGDPGGGRPDGVRRRRRLPARDRRATTRPESRWRTAVCPARLRDVLLLGDAARADLEALVERGDGGRQRRRGIGERNGEDVCVDGLRVPELRSTRIGRAMLSEQVSSLRREKVSRPLNHLSEKPIQTVLVTLRPLTPNAAPVRRKSVEDLQAEIGVHCAERQQLRASRRGTSASLERNRLEIARLQWELSHALIGRYARHAAAVAAARRSRLASAACGRDRQARDGGARLGPPGDRLRQRRAARAAALPRRRVRPLVRARRRWPCSPRRSPRRSCSRCSGSGRTGAAPSGCFPPGSPSAGSGSGSPPWPRATGSASR